MAAPLLSRRDMMTLSAAGAVTFSCSGWLEALADQTANNPQRRRSCILLWMNGGPSQMDTFDLKPGHANGGPFQEIPTSVPGVRISEHLPKIARNMQDIALIRSMSTPQGDDRHNRRPNPQRLASHRPVFYGVAQSSAWACHAPIGPVVVTEGAPGFNYPGAARRLCPSRRPSDRE